jgi:hypothetical protein
MPQIGGVEKRVMTVNGSLNCSLRESTCPYCGRAIVFNQAQLEILHEEPDCPQFEQLVLDNGGSFDGLVELVKVK